VVFTVNTLKCPSGLGNISIMTANFRAWEVNSFARQYKLTALEVWLLAVSIAALLRAVQVVL